MIKVDEKCIRCGMCIEDCMSKVIEFDENKVPQAVHPQRCINCQHCLAICPTGALSFKDKSPENSDPIQPHNPDELLNLIKSRRSYRKYKKENLPKDVMDKLKNMLNWVPTGVNNHRLVFSFVDDIEVMDDIRTYTNNKIIKILSNPLFNSKKFDRYRKPILAGQDVAFRGAPHMIIVSTPKDAPCTNIDPVIALSYFELYAQSLGVSTTWCGIAYYIFNNLPELQHQLEIPDGYKLGYVMLFGYSDLKYQRTTQPEPYKIISVKKGNRSMSLKENLKRLLKI